MTSLQAIGFLLGFTLLGCALAFLIWRFSDKLFEPREEQRHGGDRDEAE